jgi:hypothetical protein
VVTPCWQFNRVLGEWSIFAANKDNYDSTPHRLLLCSVFLSRTITLFPNMAVMQTLRFRKRWSKTVATQQPSSLHSFISFENETRREEEPFTRVSVASTVSHTLQTVVDGGSSLTRVCVDHGSLTSNPSPSRPKLHGGVVDVPLKTMCVLPLSMIPPAPL